MGTLNALRLSITSTLPYVLAVSFAGKGNARVVNVPETATRIHAAGEPKGIKLSLGGLELYPCHFSTGSLVLFLNPNKFMLPPEALFAFVPIILSYPRTANKNMKLLLVLGAVSHSRVQMCTEIPSEGVDYPQTLIHQIQPFSLKCRSSITRRFLNVATTSFST